MGIIEIILTVFAWKKGWNWYSIIPMIVAFVIGFGIGAAGIDPSTAIVVDVLAIVVLGIMCYKAPNEVNNDNKDNNETKKDS